MNNDEKVLLASFFTCGDMETEDDSPIPQINARRILSELFLMDDQTARSRFSGALKSKPDWFNIIRGINPDRLESMVIKLALKKFFESSDNELDAKVNSLSKV